VERRGETVTRGTRDVRCTCKLHCRNEGEFKRKFPVADEAGVFVDFDHRHAGYDVGDRSGSREVYDSCLTMRLLDDAMVLTENRLPISEWQMLINNALVLFKLFHFCDEPDESGI